MKKTALFLALSFVLVAPACPKPVPALPPKLEPVSQPTAATKPALKKRPLKTVKVTKERIQLEEGKVILFETGSDKLVATSFEILDEVVEAMNQEASIKIRVEGHTDDVGDDKKNLELSKKRAASVKSYIEGKGIAADRVASEGCGEASPIADNKTDDGKTKNRRVEFVILATGAEATCKIYQAQAAVQ